MSDKKEDSLAYTMRYMRELRKELEQAKKENNEKRLAALGKTAPKEKSWQEHMYVDADKPGTMDNGTATIWYIIVMVVGALFYDRWWIWITATIIWWRHITRKARRQKEWDEKHNGGNK